MSESSISKAELLQNMQIGWQDFKTFHEQYTPEQLATPTDAAGWTPKDHMMHLAVWEDGMYAVLEKTSRSEQMGFDSALWESGYDVINDIIWKQHRDKSLEEVLSTFEAIHQRLIDKVQNLSDEDLKRPYLYYQPNSVQVYPVIGYIIGNTYKHYAEHQEWIEAIITK